MRYYKQERIGFELDEISAEALALVEEFNNLEEDDGESFCEAFMEHYDLEPERVILLENMGTIEVIDYMDSLGLSEDFCIGNAIKYLSRYKHKGKPLQDLQKARWYLKWVIAKYEAEMLQND